MVWSNKVHFSWNAFVFSMNKHAVHREKIASQNWSSKAVPWFTVCKIWVQKTCYGRDLCRCMCWIMWVNIDVHLMPYFNRFIDHSNANGWWAFRTERNGTELKPHTYILRTFWDWIHHVDSAYLDLPFVCFSLSKIGWRLKQQAWNEAHDQRKIQIQTITTTLHV